MSHYFMTDFMTYFLKKLFLPRPDLVQKHSNARGFSLLELLLVVGVIGLATLGISRITQSWIDNESANNAGQHLSRVTSLVRQYINARGTSLPATTDAILAGQVPGSPWEDLYNTLDQEGFIQDNALFNPAGVSMTITYTINPFDNTYRASIISLENLPNRRVLQIARHVGSTGGTVMSMPNAPTTLNLAVGAFGQWSVHIDDLVPGGEAAFPCERTLEQGCLVSVVNYTQDELCGSYLYRNSTSCPGGNSMYTNLNMNNRSIRNVQQLDTVDMYVSDTANLGNTTIAGSADFHGPTTMADGLTVNNGMNVTGNVNFANNVELSGGGTFNVSSLNVHDIRTSQIRTNNLDAENMEISGSMLVEDNMTVHGNVVVAPDASAGMPSTIYADTINASTVNATGGQIMTGTMTVQNTMTITGGLEITGTQKTLYADRLIAEECVRVEALADKGSFGNC